MVTDPVPVLEEEDSRTVDRAGARLVIRVKAAVSQSIISASVSVAPLTGGGGLSYGDDLLGSRAAVTASR